MIDAFVYERIKDPEVRAHVAFGSGGLPGYQS